MRIFKISKFITNSSSCSFAVLIERDGEHIYSDEEGIPGPLACRFVPEEESAFKTRTLEHAKIMHRTMLSRSDEYCPVTTMVWIGKQASVVETEMHRGADVPSVFEIADYLRAIRDCQISYPDGITSSSAATWNHIIKYAKKFKLENDGLEELQ